MHVLQCVWFHQDLSLLSHCPVEANIVPRKQLKWSTFGEPLRRRLLYHVVLLSFVLEVQSDLNVIGSVGTESYYHLAPFII